MTQERKREKKFFDALEDEFQLSLHERALNSLNCGRVKLFVEIQTFKRPHHVTKNFSSKN